MIAFHCFGSFGVVAHRDTIALDTFAQICYIPTVCEIKSTMSHSERNPLPLGMGSIKPPASWEEQQRALATARVLADFANLEPDGVERFQAAHPDFVPQAWWDYQPNDSEGQPFRSKQWEIVQLNLRDAWRYRFQIGLIHSMFLLTAVFDPEELVGEGHPLCMTGLNILELDSYPYHEAIQWLHGQGWRLKTCLHCKKHFVAEHSKTKFCSYGEPGDDNWTPNCFQAHRRKYQQEYWDECRDRTNKRRRQKYQLEKKGSPRLQGSQRKRALR
jgi:hypothetical protein